jgi:zona occludens toxin (predicted ATPase)
MIAPITAITDKTIPATIASGRHIANNIVKITNDNMIIKINCIASQIIHVINVFYF